MGQDFVDNIKEVNAESSSVTPLYIPYYNDSPAELNLKEGFSGISFMTSGFIICRGFGTL